MRVLLLSAYHAPSHAYWAQGLQETFPHWHWQLISLPARYFNWRIRGNALHIAYEYQDLLVQQYDLIIATSMTDLAGLRSLCPQLAAIPSILYFHENQFSYPGNEVQSNRVEPQMMTLFSALTATRLVFNSHYNRETFFAGLGQLLKKLPDCVPANLLASLTAKADVLPVPLADQAFELDCHKSGKPSFIWNHRWEHDKAPERLLAALKLLTQTQRDFSLHVVGQQFRSQPSCFTELQQLLQATDTVGAWGFQESRETYNHLLASSHAVISTALHDFQGLAVLEAVAAGCIPLVPKRLAYPEWFPDAGYGSYETDAGLEAQALAEAMLAVIDGAGQPCPDVSSMSRTAQAPAYERLILSVAGH
ncbi:DUF3524 domain-containing protein [Simiduia curdlanivorans]|uniref:tRNA-queuosine alpha-mannosyltransferase n=1 Tax=Simiduia curdlanivorans TaxID=1492769 RepID=A0ABV8V828_9GAMM|nr:DUF3524 domain-containing protein [Simiduia curdlanivorans]MDN3639603.1 DUF3524 domain-containing protein [Simiduia curdlanivorans]